MTTSKKKSLAEPFTFRARINRQFISKLSWALLVFGPTLIAFTVTCSADNDDSTLLANSQDEPSPPRQAAPPRRSRTLISTVEDHISALSPGTSPSAYSATISDAVIVFSDEFMDDENDFRGKRLWLHKQRDKAIYYSGSNALSCGTDRVTDLVGQGVNIDITMVVNYRQENDHIPLPQVREMECTDAEPRSIPPPFDISATRLSNDLVNLPVAYEGRVTSVTEAPSGKIIKLSHCEGELQIYHRNSSTDVAAGQTVDVTGPLSQLDGTLQILADDELKGSSLVVSGTPATSPEPGPGVEEGVCRDSDDENCIQIATFNIENFSSTPGGFAPPASEARIAAITGIINDNGFDLVALQEVSDSGIETLLDHLGRDDWQYAIGATGFNQHVAYLYKTSLMSLTAMEIFQGDSDWRNLRLPLVARVRLSRSNKNFQIAVLHFKANSQASSCIRRRNQVNDMNAWLKTQSGKIILTGDFNDTIPGNGICSSVDTLADFENNCNYKFITTAANGFGSGDNRLTYIQRPFRSVIDHFYVENSVRNDDLHPIPINGGNQIAEVVPHGNVRISDHQPVYIWIRNFKN